MLLSENKLTINSLKGYVVGKDPLDSVRFSKNIFWQYTDLLSLEKFLCNKTLYASNICCLNDKNEAKDISDRERYFVTCFCNTQAERVSMWSLYSGYDGGVSFGITPTLMKRILTDLKIIGCSKTEYVKEPLIINEDVEVRFNWVLYKDSKNSRIKYRNTMLELNDDEKRKLSNYQVFSKDYPWEYEYEFRIVIKIINDKKLKKYHHMLIDLNGIDDNLFFNQLRYRVYPSSDERRTIIKNRLINELNINQKYIKDSLLNIDLRPCNKNRDLFIENIKCLIENPNEETKDCDYLDTLKATLSTWKK